MKLIIASICALFALLLPDVSNANIAVTKKAITWAFCGHKYKSCWLGNEAIEVSNCETGGTFSIWAENGQYKGLFQMGDSERQRWGFGNNAWDQAAAAYRMYKWTSTHEHDYRGRWHRWDCRP